MTFFLGLPPPSSSSSASASAHGEWGRRIAQNGAEFVRRCWRDEDWEVYLARVFVEWQRVVWREEDE